MYFASCVDAITTHTVEHPISSRLVCKLGVCPVAGMLCETPLNDVLEKARARKQKANEALLRAKTLKLGDVDSTASEKEEVSTAAPETPTSGERGTHWVGALATLRG